MLHLGYIARYEAGTRIPSLLVLLAFARVAKISLESLVDDRITYLIVFFVYLDSHIGNKVPFGLFLP